MGEEAKEKERTHLHRFPPLVNHARKQGFLNLLSYILFVSFHSSHLEKLVH